MSEGFFSKYIKVNRKQGVALGASFGGWLMDSMDLVTVLIVFALIGSKLFWPKVTPAMAVFMTTMTYAITILARPLGSALFGHLADIIGRKSPLIWTVLGYGLTTLAMGFIPTAEVVGVATAVAIVFILRFISGIFVGGEYAAGYPLGMEFLEKEKRGFWSGFLQSGYPWGYMLATAITLIYEIAYGYPSAAYFSWGWRLTFITAGLIPIAVFLPIRIRLLESPIFAQVKAAGKTEKAPFIALFAKRENLIPFLQVFLLSIGLFLGYLMILGELPAVLTLVYKVPGPIASEALILNTALGGIFYILFSTASQFIGRRLMYVILGIVAIIADLTIYPAIAHVTSTIHLLYTLTALLALGYAYWGLVPAYLSERFRTTVRATGVGFGYSSGIFIGGFYPFYVSWLSAAVHSLLWAIIIIGVIGSALVAIAAAIGPETKDVDLAQLT
jgi:MFS family permease